MPYVSPKEAAKQLGVSITTLRRWDAEGKIKAIRTPAVREDSKLDDFQQKQKPTVCYARVSTYSQRDDLERQVEFLRRAYPQAELVREIGSGLNFRRKKFLSILERVYQGDLGCLVCAYPDRLARFGFPLIKWLCEQAKCELVVLNERALSPEQELVEDILSILHCFSARLYGLRKYKKQVQEAVQEKPQEPIEKIDTERCQENQGLSL